MATFLLVVCIGSACGALAILALLYVPARAALPRRVSAPRRDDPRVTAPAPAAHSYDGFVDEVATTFTPPNGTPQGAFTGDARAFATEAPTSFAIALPPPRSHFASEPRTVVAPALPPSPTPHGAPTARSADVRSAPPIPRGAAPDTRNAPPMPRGAAPSTRAAVPPPLPGTAPRLGVSAPQRGRHLAPPPRTAAPPALARSRAARGSDAPPLTGEIVTHTQPSLQPPSDFDFDTTFVD